MRKILIHFCQVRGRRTVLDDAIQNAGYIPILFANAATEKGDENFHEHFAVVNGAVHFVVVDRELDLTLDALEHVGEIAKLMAREFRQNRTGDAQAIDIRIARQKLWMLGVGDVQKSRIEVCVMGYENRGLAAENGELFQGCIDVWSVFHHFVCNVVHSWRLVRNHHGWFYQGLEFRNFFGTDDAVVVVNGEFDGTDFHDFIFVREKTRCFQVESDEGRINHSILPIRIKHISKIA